MELLDEPILALDDMLRMQFINRVAIYHKPAIFNFHVEILLKDGVYCLGIDQLIAGGLNSPRHWSVGVVKREQPSA
jgi:hypothetical protein